MLFVDVYVHVYVASADITEDQVFVDVDASPHLDPA
jgi:hypothetical protein